MPLVKVEIIEGKNQKYKKALLDNIYDALVSAIKIPDDNRNHRLYEFSPENFEKRSTRTDSLL